MSQPFGKPSLVHDQVPFIEFIDNVLVFETFQ